MRRPSTRLTYRWPLAEKLRYWSRPDEECGCVLWTGAVFAGTGYAQLFWKGRPRRANRLAWVCARGPVPNNLHVLHKCDNRRCVNLDHLFLGTHQDNMDDRQAKGRTKPPPKRYGEDNPGAKLTSEIVVAIRAAQGAQTSIAARFGISQSTVSEIRSGKRWPRLRCLPVETRRVW